MELGVAIGTDPTPYRLDYRLETRAGFVTSRLDVKAAGEGSWRRLDLRRSSAGVWSAAASEPGEVRPSALGGDAELLAGALDCDLGLSPLTNTMPVLRHDLLHGGGPIDLTTAWVSVPTLTVRASAQRYTFIRSDSNRHVVRYEDETDFVADIVFDDDGLVVAYPGLARRL